MLDLEAAAQLDLELDLETDLELALEQDPTTLLLYGLANLSPSNYLSTAIGGGEAGTAAGFLLGFLWRLDFLTTVTTNYWFGRGGAGEGTLIYTTPTPAMGCRLTNGAAADVLLAEDRLTASDIGKLYLTLVQHDGANGRHWSRRSNLSTVAITGYTPAAARATTFGFVNTPNGLTALGGFAARGTPTAAQVQALFDTVRSLGDVPTAIEGATMTHRWSLRDELRGTVVTQGQAAPAQLTDTITRAANDALARVGAPTVVKIDPTIEGRRTLGAQGFSAGNTLTTAPGKGVRGSASFVIGFRSRGDSSPSGTEYLASCLVGTPPGFGGWDISTPGGGGAVNTRMCDSTGAYTSAPAIPLVAGERGAPFYGFIVCSGGFLRSYTAKIGQPLVECGSAVAINGYKAAALTESMRIGAGSSGALPTAAHSMFALQGGDGSPTMAQLAECVEASERTGVFQPIAGLTNGHLYDLTADILASGLEDVPAVVLDRIGTDHIARGGPDYQIGGRRALRLNGLGAAIASGLATAPGGGILGAATLTVSALFVPISAASVVSVLASRCSTQGWNFTWLPAGTLNALVRTATSGDVGSATYTVLPGDYGTMMHLALVWTGTQLFFYINGVQVGAPVACTGVHTPVSTLPMLIGSQSNGYSMTNNGGFVAIGGGAYVATQAELAAQATASIAAGRLVAIPGKTDERRYNFDHDAVDQGTPLPARCVNRANATDDPLVRIGSGLTLAQRKERVWSYETSPIMQCGASSGAGANRWEGAPSLDTGGGASGFFLGLMLRSKGTTNARILSHSGGGPQGWNVTGNAGVLVGFNFVDGSGVNRSAPSITVPAGKAACVMATLDGATIKGFHNRAQVGASTTCVGYGATNLGAVGPTLGGLYGGGSPNPDWEVFGWVMGYALPSLAEFGAWEDACIAMEDIAELGINKSAHLYSFKRGRSGNRLLDLIGTAHMEPIGSPVVTDVYGRAFAR